MTYSDCDLVLSDYYCENFLKTKVFRQKIKRVLQLRTFLRVEKKKFLETLDIKHTVKVNH
jgi:hypothetical protein